MKTKIKLIATKLKMSSAQALNTGIEKYRSASNSIKRRKKTTTEIIARLYAKVWALVGITYDLLRHHLPVMATLFGSAAFLYGFISDTADYERDLQTGGTGMLISYSIFIVAFAWSVTRVYKILSSKSYRQEIREKFYEE